MDSLTTTSRRPIVIELLIVTILLLTVVKFLFVSKSNPIIAQTLSAIVAILFIYTPIAILMLKKRPVDFLDRDAKDYTRSLLVFLIATVIIFPPFLIAAHGWQIFIGGYKHFSLAALPKPFQLCLFQLLLVALPEEFFFRGYCQSTLNLIFKRSWSFLGTHFGPSLFITAAVFALAHSLVFYQWWHFSIFFPALVFGFLRERTGSITAPVFFHATANIIVDWLVRSYN